MLSTGVLDGKAPIIPTGVSDYAKANQEDVLTWQPRAGVRMALVVEHTTNEKAAFVAVGWSLEEVEKEKATSLR